MRNFLFILGCLCWTYTSLLGQTDSLQRVTLDTNWYSFYHDQREVPYLLLGEPDAPHVVVLIHNELGITRSLMRTAETLTQFGYRVMVPNWLDAFHIGLDQQGTTRSLSEVQDLVSSIPIQPLMSSMVETLKVADTVRRPDGSLILMGVGWGGSQAFELATRSTLPDATIVIDGDGPMLAAHCARLTAPVYGFYGGSKSSVSRSVSSIGRYMLASGKTFEPTIFPGVAPGYLLELPNRQSTEAREARRATNSRIQALLRAYAQ